MRDARALVVWVIAMDEYEKVFQTVTSVVLGRKLAGHADYERWLTRQVSSMGKARSVMSGKPVIFPEFEFFNAITHKMLTLEEAYEVAGKKHLSEEQVRGLSLANAAETLKDISITTPETIMGTCSMIKECAMYYDSTICYKSALMNTTKGSLYTYWPRHSEYVLGCHYAFSCNFCIRCFYSENLTRCFEVSDSANCSDCYFCYNCENLQDSMFCFNTKSKKHAIANVELPREKYKEIKQKVLDSIVKKLEKDKTLDASIFSLS
ncbi:MAG: hypothetical protein PHF60_05155 [Candidatus ainarchaeum sp.]|nr:hypothetical protein [Candidatus ainarchaeum sp.]